MRAKAGFENVTLVTMPVPQALPSEFANVTADVCDVLEKHRKPLCHSGCDGCDGSKSQNRTEDGEITMKADERGRAPGLPPDTSDEAR